MARSDDPSRRDALKALGVLAGAGLAGCDEPSEAAPTHDTGVADPATAVDTIVILMMENRSFDHYFGSLSLDEGRTDVDGLTAGMSNPDASGAEVAPFHLERECLKDPPHGWDSSRVQFDAGSCRGFVLAHDDGTEPHSREAIGYYRRADLPIYHALADDNALCDRWFSSVMSSTWPNRFYAVSATSKGVRGNDLPPGGLYDQRTIFDQLTDAGISWAIYFHEIPHTGLLANLDGTADEDHFRPIEQYVADAAAGRLPQVCWVEPSYVANDDHPPHPPALGQVLAGMVYRALAESPHWDRCMMVIEYDEHGGFFDHVAPPRVPDDHAADGFDQLGFRVPALVLGPYARPEVVHTQLEHVSVLSHIQDVFGLPRLNARNEATAALWDCLDLDRMARRDPRPPTPLPTVEVDPDGYGSDCTYFFHPGQVELEIAVDRGQVPAALDRRDELPRILDRVLAQAMKLGVARLR